MPVDLTNKTIERLFFAQINALTKKAVVPQKPRTFGTSQPKLRLTKLRLQVY